MPNQKNPREATDIQWHPAFYSAIEREFRDNSPELQFIRELPLTSGPLAMDMLVVRMVDGAKLQNEIGHIFRKHNVIEYKSPEDGLNIDDYYKTVGYACLYKASGETVDAVEANEITVSLIRDTYPKELISHLKGDGFEISEEYPGIFYIGRENYRPYFPTQIVVTSQLRTETHSSLRILRKNADEQDVRLFLTEARGSQEKRDRDIVDSILQVSVAANQELFEKIRRDETMCQALRELMKDDMEKQFVAGEEAGKKAGKEEARLSAIKSLMQTMHLTADAAMKALQIPDKEQPRYSGMLNM